MKELDDIRARNQRANDEMDRLTNGSPGINWRWSIPANPERDSDIILSASVMDVPRLVQALETVTALHRPHEETGKCVECTPAPYSAHGVSYPCATVRAIQGALRVEG